MTLARRQIIRAFKLRGWVLQPAALEGIEGYLNESQDAAEDLEALLDVVRTKMESGRIVTGEIWNEMVEESNNDVQKPEKLGNSGFADMEVLSAFQTPKLVYDVMRKQFDVQLQRWTLFGSAEEKTNMLAQRYALIYQRIMRHKLFRPRDLHNARSNDQLKLTPIESLLGQRAASSERLLLLGILTQIEEGHYYLEDPTGQVALSLQDIVPIDGFFVTEHCILLVEGTFQDDVLYVHRLGHPLLETRETSLRAIQHQVSHPSYQLRKPSFQDDGASFVIFSDVQLDRPRVLQQLEGILASYENYSSFRLPLFVLMGNFCSQIQPKVNAVKEALEDLVSLLSKFPKLAQHAHFCIVPGPNDTPSQVLPLPPIRLSARHKISHLHLASNPCRIQWAGREMVIFRHDLLNLLQQRQILLPQENNNHLNQPYYRLVKTVLDQGHLAPVADVPIYWNYDHALRLYPLPDALVLGGDDSSTFHEIYGDCDVIHPGSLATLSSYAIYQPGIQDLDSDDDDEDMGGGSNRVQFYQVGDEATTK